MDPISAPPPARSTVPDRHVIVLFGATGDLSARKLLPGFFHLGRVGLMPDDFRLIGTSHRRRNDDVFRAVARDAVERYGRTPLDDRVWDEFEKRLSYVPSGADDMSALVAAVASARADLGGSARVLLYLSVPPDAVSGIITALGRAGINDEGVRVILEKPFGTDIDSARALNELLHEAFAEPQIFRIDHFLGKEDVQNILAVRFANRLFEPVWSNQHVDAIYIDVPETLGVEQRARFYEQTGAFRDMVVTHLFQALGFLTMEAPVTFTADALADQKQRVFGALQPLDPTRVVRGQYEGYRDVAGVAPDSDTETLVALEVHIDNRRWDGVPIYLRTGKRMPQGRRVITLTLEHPPLEMFGELTEAHRNELVFEIGEPGSIRIDFQSKEPGPTMALGRAHLDFVYKQNFDPRCELEAYERLLHDAMNGDRTLFNRAEGIERLWAVSAPLLAAPPPAIPYVPGTWGPPEASELLAPRHWHLPDTF